MEFLAYGLRILLTLLPPQGGLQGDLLGKPPLW